MPPKMKKTLMKKALFRQMRAAIMDSTDSDHSTSFLSLVMSAEVLHSAVDDASPPLFEEEDDDASTVVSQPKDPMPFSA